MSGADRRTAIVTALPEEARAIARAVGARAVPALRAEPSSLVVAWTGDGAARARRNLALLLNRTRPGRLIGAGVAGALTNDLARGSIVRPAAASDEAGNRVSLADGLAGHLIVSTARPILSPAGKQALARTVSAVSNTVVDLETFAWAEVAANRKTPFSAVRSVLDDARRQLPDFLERAFRPDGSTDRRAVALSAITHPFRIGPLVTLRRELAQACDRLAAAVAAALRELS